MVSFYFILPIKLDTKTNHAVSFISHRIASKTVKIAVEGLPSLNTLLVVDKIIYETNRAIRSP